MTKALVIDDDDIAREVIRSILEGGGYKTYDLPSPIGATQMILSERIDVLVVDLYMPSLSGDKLAKMLRQNRRLEGLTIVLVSSASIEELRPLANSVQADAVVSKADIRKQLLPAITSARAAHSRRGAAG